MWADSKRGRRVRPVELRAAFMHGGQAMKYAVKREGGGFLSRISLLWPLCFRFVSLSSRSLFL